MTNMRAVAFFGAVLLTAACSGNDKKTTEPVSSGGGSGKNAAPAEPSASAHRVTLTNSLSNNGLTSQTINRSKAESEAQHFASAKDPIGLESRVSAERLAGKSGLDVL